MTTTPASAPRLREPTQRVSPRARLLWAASSAVQAVVIAAVVVVIDVSTPLSLPVWVFIVLALVLVGFVAAVPHWRFLVHRWEVTDTAVYTQTGWWARERRIAPMSRIQTVDLNERPIARLLGLATVTVTTASAAGALHIEGLDRQVARELVDELTLKADAEVGDAT